MTGADLWTRAADRLEKLDQAATPGDWCGYSDCPHVQPRGEIFAGPRDEHGYRTGSVCSWSEDDEDGHVMSQADIDLICALRDLAPEIAALLRAKVRAAEVRECTVPGFRFQDHAMDRIARIVIGETEAPAQEGTTTP